MDKPRSIKWKQGLWLTRQMWLLHTLKALHTLLHHLIGVLFLVRESLQSHIQSELGSETPAILQFLLAYA